MSGEKGLMGLWDELTLLCDRSGEKGLMGLVCADFSMRHEW